MQKQNKKKSSTELRRKRKINKRLKERKRERKSKRNTRMRQIGERWREKEKMSLIENIKKKIDILK